MRKIPGSEDNARLGEINSGHVETELGEHVCGGAVSASKVKRSTMRETVLTNSLLQHGPKIGICPCWRCVMVLTTRIDYAFNHFDNFPSTVSSENRFYRVLTRCACGTFCRANARHP